MGDLTLEEIRELIVEANLDSIGDRLASLPEEQRGSLASDVLDLASDIDRFSGPSEKSQITPPRSRDLLARIKQTKYPGSSGWRLPRWASQLFVLGLCDCEPIKFPHKFKVNWIRTDLQDLQPRLLKILDDRRPRWLAEWLQWEWKQESPVPSWYVERGLIRSGALPANDSPEYYARMANDRAARAKVRSDPELLKHDLWRLFQVDSVAFRFPDFGWPKFFIDLIEEGRIDRTRVLSESLNGMMLPLSKQTLAGIAKFHEQLCPTVQESEQLTDAYLRLLHVNNSTIVGHAVATLEKLNLSKRLDSKAFLANLPGVFLTEKKAPAIKAIGIALKMVQADPSAAVEAIQALLGALRHAELDVQSSAIKALSNLRAFLSADDLAQIAAQLDMVAIAMRQRVQDLLDELALVQSKQSLNETSRKVPQRPPQAKVPVATAVVVKGTSKQGVDQRDDDSSSLDLTGLAPTVRHDSRLDDSLRVRENGGIPTIFPVAKFAIPRRDPGSRIVPIQDLDELITSIATLIERVDDVMEIELILDGISRFHRERPVDFDKRVDALRKQVVKRSEPYSRSTLDVGADLGLTELLTTWLDLAPVERSPRLQWHVMRGWFQRGRIYELIDRLESTKQADTYASKRKPVGLLALPTHRGGWIDPVVLVQRINEHYAAQNLLIDDHDLAQSLLRMSPDGRDEALRDLGEPSHYNGGRLLRYALGDDLKIEWNPRYAVIHVAAERARRISLAHEGYQSPLPIAHATLGDQQQIVLSGALLSDPTVPFELLEAGFSFAPKLAYVHEHSSRHLWPERWDAMTNPIDTDASCLAGQTAHLLDSEATWTSAACRLATIAASHDRGEIRVLATDAMMGAFGRLLLVPDVFGQALADNIGLLKLNRFCKAFADVARASKLNQWLALQCLEVAICDLADWPHDFHLLLAQMVESAIGSGATIKAKTLQKLSGVAGNTKTGKLASQLLSLTPDVRANDEINQAVVEIAFARAERWQRCL